MNWYTDPVRGTWGPFCSRKALIATLRDAFVCGVILGLLLALWGL